MTESPEINSIIWMVVIGIVLGIVYYVIGRAPILEPLFKKVLQWVIILIGAVVLIRFLLNFPWGKIADFT